MAEIFKVGNTVFLKGDGAFHPMTIIELPVVDGIKMARCIWTTLDAANNFKSVKHENSFPLSQLTKKRPPAKPMPIPFMKR